MPYSVYTYDNSMATHMPAKTYRPARVLGVYVWLAIVQALPVHKPVLASHGVVALITCSVTIFPRRTEVLGNVHRATNLCDSLNKRRRNSGIDRLSLPITASDVVGYEHDASEASKHTTGPDEVPRPGHVSLPQASSRTAA